MQLLRIEPTPSPNSMKLHLDTNLPDGVRRTYTLQHKHNAPALIQKLLEIDGVKSIFHTADFIALDRKPHADWAGILAHVQQVFGWSKDAAQVELDENAAYSFGEAQVYVQYFRAIPMQIRVQGDGKEERIGLSARFLNAVHEVASATLIKERKLSDYGIRYGELADIAREVEQELEATYSDDRLKSLVEQAVAKKSEETPFVEERTTWDEATIHRMLTDADWRTRYAALDQLQATEEHLPLLGQLLHDPQSQIRRLVVIYLGAINTPAVLPHLFKALTDSSVSVRRTAGDTLSDIGDPSAMEPMKIALQDSNKLVRWRAARFLYEVGDEQSIAALTAALDDTEFEVALQARMALERIQSGEEAAGTVWQQMARSRQDE
ncbi:virulence factor [Paenibacillus sp. UMB4589-SE434]|uniref:virulence factor n=1 Tax=Paenibacillus sp. UMB4589-SE434 TaxID=3046314 RepID=UPI00254CF812|nr:virulence factor [Paenibacillus sp. UMB4589-SE434]MDK8181949.1 virulence factor [Paenibacillus sp. UMB4589-SE434]